MESTKATKQKKYIQRALVVIAVLIGINVLAGYFHGRLDLTREKRFTLSQPTKQLLRKLDGTVSVTVFLKGDYPSSFKQLAQTTQELLASFKEYGGPNIQYDFINPSQGLSDSSFAILQDSLAAKGIMAYNLQVQQEANQGYAEKLIFPAAMLHYKDRTISVNLLKSQGGQDPQAALNSSESLLEYQFANAIRKLQQTERPLIGYMLGHGESLGLEVYDALNTLQNNYRLDTVTLQAHGYIPPEFNAIIFTHPTERFTDEDKLKIDQYVMHGGRVMWMIDPLSASIDSMNGQQDYMAFDQGLNLEDILFRYGVRINSDLVEDLQCDLVPQVVGNMGGKPQIQPLPFPFFPLLQPAGTHPIVKNMDEVMSRFVSSIDTVGGSDIVKTILLTTDHNSRRVPAPVKLSWSELSVKPNPREFRLSQLPVAVLLEGKFKSLFQHRLSRAEEDSFAQLSGKDFIQQADTINKMIIVSDADVITNAVSQKNGPLQMGVNLYNPDYVFANKEFFLNSLEYLTTNDAGIMETRNKELVLRLLDPKKVTAEKTKWQAICFLVPIGLVLLFAMIFQFIRQQKNTK
ncbi:gliding-associated putative ABC transporter substrate-binding component GldG [Chitinophaga costaii]|uniref:Gliding-associated putative ABC transporter substrate-binding component GldG n=1 Tax=Chitinophaga costaii TaxID=1335309 RepID=A0A1C4DQT8_9BACT|nr:gliding motility-associated ABC transporter substrate-binding protein GldG [Chitinophaga costaii]PUZ27745.1 gliding motility-associated ABC transporter substrate-binding protein GldG [Chitinophaga costaii]SCC33738.1 gliding-associated putative ABC transporter substrate-binding component GldG [Chitinophaga costaii]